ncbi:Cyclin-dependent kinase catalytic subunit, variant 2 [Entomophthora muscae]|nr:Cyclin-dependent kinase catalytic subunit, variant 2 [Entomophthora muscae]
MFLIFELHPRDLEHLMNSAKKTGYFSASIIKRFMRDILSGINFIHSRKLIHRDLKPTNILVAADFQLKLCDFGFCRAEDLECAFTPEVGTCYYYSPEVCLGRSDYGWGVDIWAVGCIFAELFKLAPFFEGETKLANLLSIFRQLGSPTEENWPQFSKMDIPLEFPCTPGIPLSTTFPRMDAQALDLLQKLLAYSPARRCSALVALRHPYLAQLDAEGSKEGNPAKIASSMKCTLL